MIKSNLDNEIILARYQIQLREWQVAKLDAQIAHETHKEIGSSSQTIENLANRVIETEKAIRSITARIVELQNPVTAIREAFNQ